MSLAVMVMAAHGIGVEDQRAVQKRLDGRIRAAGSAREQLDARLGPAPWRAPPPMPPQISVSAPCVFKKPASAPWPLPTALMTSLDTTALFSTV